MSWQLLHFFLRDDVDAFSRLLAGATFTTAPAPPGTNASSSNTNNAYKNSSAVIGASSLSYGSPTAFSKHRRKSSISFSFSPADRQALANTTLTRNDINARDKHGRTLMHLIASSDKESAYGFASALLAVPVPFLDIYIQDAESGWTCLHRALYAGNISIAQAILHRDGSGGLVKIKDREGNSPFEVFHSSVVYDTPVDTRKAQDDSEDEESVEADDEVGGEQYGNVKSVAPRVSLDGDELFTFGSNKNLSLGVGDSDDRQFPERITLPRSEALIHRFYEEKYEDSPESETPEEIPFLVRATPLIVQDVAMSKLHTAILTTDPCSNLYMCGFGPGGRLGTGHEGTSFSPVCVDSGAIAGKRITSVALGLDHTIAISDQGEVFSWGSNKHGQLGYTLPKTKPTASSPNDVPTQLSPRQIFNPFKRDRILGAAASSIHSAVFTSSALYTFGRNDGQLGLMDADARSLTTQPIPRKVGASLFSVPISSVCAIERATVVLLENHEVWVFTHYGYSRLIFPLTVSVSNFIRSSFMATRYGAGEIYVTKIRAGGNTICALSNGGEVFTVSVPGRREEERDRDGSKQMSTSASASASTTNPAKIRNSLPQPTRTWAVKKSHMAVCDVDVGQDGSIIICTKSGTAWLKERRAGIKPTVTAVAAGKEYKFARVPNISRAVGVRSNAFGAYAVIQRTCDVARRNILVDEPRLRADIRPLIPFGEIIEIINEGQGRIDIRKPISPYKSKDADEGADVDVEKEMSSLLDTQIASSSLSSPSIAWLSTSLSDTRIPVHEFMLSSRSPILRNALSTFRKEYYFSLPGAMSIEYDKAGQVHLLLTNISFLALFNLAVYLYTDRLYDVWLRNRNDKKQTDATLANAALYRQVRIEVLKLAAALDMSGLERAARIMTQPATSLPNDMATAIKDTSFFDTADVLIELSGDEEVKAHSHILYSRCTFFDGLFRGRAGGRWLHARVSGTEREVPEPIHVDLSHVEPSVWDFVMRYLYSDIDEELFDNVNVSNTDAFMDIVIDVLSVANELMIDRLAQICQRRLSTFVTIQNVCQLLNAVMPCSVKEFKRAALEFICFNLEIMLEHRLLDELDPDLRWELDQMCQDKQLTSQPISRGRNPASFLAERYPEVVPLIEQDKNCRVDAMKLRSHLHEDEVRDTMLRPGSLERDKTSMSPLSRKGKQVGIITPPSDKPPVVASPTLVPKRSVGDLIFQMDDEPSLHTDGRRGDSLRPTPAGSSRGSPRNQPQPSTPGSGPSLGLDLGPATFPQLSGKPSYTNLQPSRAMSKVKDIPQAQSTSSINHSITPNSPPAKAPWSSITPTKTRAGLRDIMAETNNLSTPPYRIEGVSRPEAEATRNFSPKLSQKERKKLKQQQMAAEQEHNAISNTPIWQIPQSPNLKPTKADTDVDATSVPARAATPKAPLTLRQTVAGSNATPGSSVSPHIKPTYPQTPPRTQVSKSMVINASQTKSSASPSVSAGPGTSQISLATILLQQQTEKDEIHEAATAKHNLHDIQIEQEFQEWWDQESKRVMQEEQAAETKAKLESEKARSKRGSSQQRWWEGTRKGGGQSRPNTTRAVEGSTSRPAGAEATSTARPVANNQAGHPHSQSRTSVHTDDKDKKRHSDRDRGRGRHRGTPRTRRWNSSCPKRLISSSVA
ncbi:BTB/POZ domain-containing protein 1 [Nannizzia gypsea CBS 118893]|uniref:BTB/POZ domain-containing protein 1 n=1 Tax=Arthroderma gypseum (strain ATCC MYA-4604 / CBS 118893) TaxID=535722 RepID=E4V4P5_ARTGP|nr:BTB/POZ domain-containing protein 1 [Nannizzia gypsea CBS 118893]EFR04969.1 BTB/POZ domain-containing protein 1 [Nannizzia gypsea CBS 118893]